MSQLSPAGTQLVQELSNRYGISTDAVTHMLVAIQQGQGRMAQFNHPAFGGAGQWMSGGMTMVSDLFNSQLKMLVDGLCSDLSAAFANHQSTPLVGSFQSQSQGGATSQSQAASGGGPLGGGNSLFVPDPQATWWPEHLGTPAALGSQNSMRYAFFPDRRRLAVTTGGPAWVYDTLGHHIGGFSQQQGGGSAITFTSQYGVVDLSALPVVWRDGGPVQATPPSQPAPAPIATSAPSGETAAYPSAADATNIAAEKRAPAEAASMTGSAPVQPAVAAPAGSGGPNSQPADLLALLDTLGQLKDKGYLSEEEFQEKKKDILSRI